MTNVLSFVSEICQIIMTALKINTIKAINVFYVLSVRKLNNTGAVEKNVLKIEVVIICLDQNI